jgi:hypothetical protein
MCEHTLPDPGTPPRTLLTDKHMNSARACDLYATVGKLRAHLCAREERNLMDAATAWMREHELPRVVGLMFEANAWENGNYYDPAAEFLDSTGTRLEPPSDTIAAALAGSVEGVLTELSDLHGPLTQGDTLTIDLDNRTVSRW